jgi:hypothetical protein
MVIRLQPQASDLEEVVVIGYGVQKKKLNTGANLKVEGEELQKRNQLNRCSRFRDKHRVYPLHQLPVSREQI